MFAAIPFPAIDPVLVEIGPLAIRWYALAYIVGLLIGWGLARKLTSSDGLWGGRLRPTPESLDDLLVYVALGVVLGGRVGYVLFYNLPLFLQTPREIVAVWKGGMSFHGGLAGALVGAWLFARKRGVPTLSVTDLCSAVAPVGLLLGRVANFIKPELWGRPTDVAWAVIFPGGGDLPRHPSQLYEAGLEGALLFLVLMVAIYRYGALRRPGLVTGLFSSGYALARIASEFFREPDPQLGFLFGQATMGMALSLPLLAIGLVMIARALKGERA